MDNPQPHSGLPREIVRGNRTSMSLDSLLNSRHHGVTQHIPEADRVLGFKLPRWQRPAMWTPEQDAAFIESIYMGFPLGEIVVINRDYDGNSLVRRLLDGQQRLRAVERWVNGQLEVCGQRFSDLAPREQQMFGFHHVISVLWIESSTPEETLKFIYYRLNFMGTPHAPEHHPSVYVRP